MFALCLSFFVSAQPVVVSLNDPHDSAVVNSPVRVVEVRDLRRMATLDPTGIGVTTLGMFEERVPLRTAQPVSQEVEALCRKWLRSAPGALPVRLEILSLESWSQPTDGPDPFHAVARIRVISADSTRPGTLLVPEARSERKGVTTGADQAVMLATALRDAISMVRADMKPVAGAVLETAPLFDPWADPRKGAARDSLPMRLKHSVSMFGAPVWSGMTMGLRYCQNMEPQPGWTHGYWGGLLLRGPWTSKYLSDVWSGELQGGMSWWKRLDDGRSNFATVTSVGAIVGTERFRRVYTQPNGGRDHGAKDYWVYLGGEARTGLRWAELTETGTVLEGGVLSALRLPSSLSVLDFGLYASAGWRF